MTLLNGVEQINIQPVVLCGGVGARLWPLSRPNHPKQFLTLFGSESLFQSTVKRLVSLSGGGIRMAKPLIVTGVEHRFLALEQMHESQLESMALLLEPVGKNTAPALTFAAFAAMNDGEDPVLVVTPSDHFIENQEAFNSAVSASIQRAVNGEIVILGVVPDHPATEYGYIQAESIASTPSDFLMGRNTFFSVHKFIEKPDIDSARKYLKESNFFWNAGIFVLKASVWLDVLKNFYPEIYYSVSLAWKNRTVDLNLTTPLIRPGVKEFMSTPSESIDYAVMERCANSDYTVTMVLLNAGWSDVGGWDAIWKCFPKDDDGNAGVGDSLVVDSKNTLIHASGRLVILIGVRDLVVVETSDAVLVMNKSLSQNLKYLVNDLEADGREESRIHRKVYRPWGWYDLIDKGDRFKVKRIYVKPGASLSLQKHLFRAEHWIVVKGIAEITNGDRVELFTKNQSTYIPSGELHRLRNPSEMPLEIIEIQTGDRLDEDDIVRFDDFYGRGDQ